MDSKGSAVLFLITISMLETASRGKDLTKSKEVTLYNCINNCAMCVEHWEEGLYNGPRCARQCLKHKGQRIVDPDCSKLKMFNYDPEVIKKYRKYIRGQANANESKTEDS